MPSPRRRAVPVMHCHCASFALPVTYPPLNPSPIVLCYGEYGGDRSGHRSSPAKFPACDSSGSTVHWLLSSLVVLLRKTMLNNLTMLQLPKPCVSQKSALLSRGPLRLWVGPIRGTPTTHTSLCRTKSDVAIARRGVVEYVVIASFTEDAMITSGRAVVCFSAAASVVAVVVDRPALYIKRDSHLSFTNLCCHLCKFMMLKKR